MAIIFKKVIDGEKNLEIDSNLIIGIIGNNYEKFIHLLHGSNIYLVKKEDCFHQQIVRDEMLNYYDVETNKYSFEDLTRIIFNELNIKDDFLNKKIDKLSDSERKILKYILAFVSNKKIVIIDEPFIDLDYTWKKKLTSLLNGIIRNTRKTIIICSADSNIIYSLCQKVLLVGKDKYYYGNIVDVFKDIKLLNKYNIEIPDMVKFVDLAHKKKANLRYSQDIRDLIKDVYKSV